MNSSVAFSPMSPTSLLFTSMKHLAGVNWHQEAALISYVVSFVCIFISFGSKSLQGWYNRSFFFKLCMATFKEVLSAHINNEINSEKNHENNTLVQRSLGGNTWRPLQILFQIYFACWLYQIPGYNNFLIITKKTIHPFLKAKLFYN